MKLLPVEVDIGTTPLVVFGASWKVVDVVDCLALVDWVMIEDIDAVDSIGDNTNAYTNINACIINVAAICTHIKLTIQKNQLTV